MKATLQLAVEPAEDNIQNLCINLVILSKKFPITLWESRELDDGDEVKFKEDLEDAAEEMGILKNALELSITMDDSVACFGEFLDCGISGVQDCVDKLFGGL